MILFLAFIAAVVSTPPRRLQAFAAWGGMIAWASALSGVSLRKTVIRASSVLPFSLVAAIGVPFAGGGEEARILGVALSARGLWLLAGVVMKSFLSAAMLSVAVSSAGFDGVLSAIRALGAPALFAD
ncbi:hypothetical protein GX411_11545, partial [Candidatus Fermentibacteria bacterium]|nr:hypothetical protein [Candidatus Fermentibacteria bacterium]